MNFQNDRKDIPQLVVYDRFRASDTEPEVSRETLVLGAKPVLPDVPVVPFRGKLAEIIVYDRVLSPEERRRVDIPGHQIRSGARTRKDCPLPERCPTKWCATVGNPSASLHRAMGIGRDDASGLYQKQSASN